MAAVMAQRGDQEEVHGWVYGPWHIARRRDPFSRGWWMVDGGYEISGMMLAGAIGVVGRGVWSVG